MPRDKKLHQEASFSRRLLARLVADVDDTTAYLDELYEERRANGNRFTYLIVASHLASDVATYQFDCLTKWMRGRITFQPVPSAAGAATESMTERIATYIGAALAWEIFLLFSFLANQANPRPHEDLSLLSLLSDPWVSLFPAVVCMSWNASRRAEFLPFALLSVIVFGALIGLLLVDIPQFIWQVLHHQLDGPNWPLVYASEAVCVIINVQRRLRLFI